MSPLARLRRSLGSTLFQFSGAATAFSIVSMVCSIVIIRWIPPEELGAWQSLLILQSWVMILQAGVISGLSRELPFQLGSGNKESVQAHAEATLAVTLVGVVLLIAGAIIAPFYVTDTRIRISLGVVLLSSATVLYQNYLSTTYRANSSFKILARIFIVDMAVAVLSLPIVFKLGYNGLVLRFLLMAVVSVVLRHNYRPLPVWPVFHKAEIGRLLTIGTPMFAFGYLMQVVDTFPRLLLLKQNEGLLLVGLFAPISAIFGLMRMLPNSLGSYIFPQMNFTLGQTGDRKRLWTMAWKSACYFLLAALPCVILGMLTAPWLFHRFFPRYESASVAVNWALVAGAFMGSRISVNSLFSLKAWKKLTVYTVVNMAGAVLLPIMLLMWHEPLLAITKGYALSRVLSFAVVLLLVHRATMRSTDAN